MNIISKELSFQIIMSDSDFENEDGKARAKTLSRQLLIQVSSLVANVEDNNVTEMEEVAMILSKGEDIFY